MARMRVGAIDSRGAGDEFFARRWRLGSSVRTRPAAYVSVRVVQDALSPIEASPGERDIVVVGSLRDSALLRYAESAAVDAFTDRVSINCILCSFEFGGKMLNEPTLDKLRSMRLNAMADTWQEQQRSTDIATLSFDERLGLLVDAQYMHRENRRLARRLNEAKLRHSQACIEDFDSVEKRGLSRSLVQKLATCSWIAEHLNVVLTGATGVGKTYLACALGQRACRNGYRVMYRRVPRLVDELTLARADGSLPRLLSRFARLDLLILDDWGITPLRDPDRRDLLEVVEDRDGSRSTLVTSQIPISKWHDYLGDPTVADAIADRLLHSAHRITLKGPSRRKDRKKSDSELSEQTNT